MHAQPAAGAARAADRREKIKKKIRALRAYTLTEELSLDEVDRRQAVPGAREVRRRVSTSCSQQRADIERRLKAAGDDQGSARDRQADRRGGREPARVLGLEEKRLGELRKILTPAQTARLLVVLPALERKIQNQLQRAIRAAAGKAAAARKELGPNPYDGDRRRSPATRPPPPPAARRGSP